MQTIRKSVGLIAAGVLAVGSMSLVFASGDDDHDGGGFFSRWFGGSTSSTAAAADGLYQQECGSCHFPYQPGLLPALSWERLMAGLDDHFGDNAGLARGDADVIRNYLLDNAAGRVSSGLSNRVMATQGGGTPLRITDTNFFRHEHAEIPARMVAQNPDVKSFANCGACHTKAMQGSFDEHQVSIPGFGSWED